jgi:Flp pilus assembly protein TadG
MRDRHRERGTAVIETLIVMIAALSLLFGIMDFSRLLFTYETLANATREGARWAIVRGADCPNSGESGEADCPATQTEIQTYVQQQSLGQFITNPSGITVTPTWQDVSGCSGYTSGTTAAGTGCQITVSSSYTFSFLLWPFQPSITIPLTSTSVMIMSQ